MAFLDTPYLADAFRKANNAKATHYYTVSDAQDKPISYTFIAGG